jgi:undecaprenyl-diphosphatase
MADIGAAALLGLIQGLTEFLPISSTAHLFLAERLLRLDPARFGLSFDVALHMGTLLAVLLYFASTWIQLVADALRGSARAIALIAVGTIPAAAAGALLQNEVETTFRDPRLVAGALVAGSLVFIAAEYVARQRRAMPELGVADALVIGTAQAIALIPGVSRSGITISAALFRDLQRGDATRFAFLLGTPVMLGAGAKTLLDARRAEALFAQPDVLAVGFGTSFIAGLTAVAFLVRYLRTNSLAPFIVYRIVLAVAIVLAVTQGLL